jgi:hypothetical protein
MPRPRAPVLVAIVAAAIAIAVGVYLPLRPSDESRIRRQLARLAAAVRITDADASASPVGRLADVNGRLQPLFEQDVRVSIPEVASLHAGRAELAELLAGAPSSVRSFDVDFTSVTIKLDDARTTALVGATAHTRLVERDGVISRDRRAVDLRLVRKNGEWVVRTLTVWSPDDATPP